VTDFIVLTGFLGSGKTTLLADFLALPEAADTAIIVNEVGEIGLDGAILAESGDVPIAMLANGCICCSLAGDLEITVGAIMETRRGGPPLARIILETSGLSKPGPILRSLAALAPLRLRVGVVATVDCRSGATTSGFEEAAAQWAGAQALILTKRDVALPAERRRARDAAVGMNPLAEPIDTDDRNAAVRAAFSLRPMTAAAPQFIMAPGRRHKRIQVLLARPDKAILWDELAEWLDNLAGLCGERLLRVKGVVRVADRPQPILVQSVGTLFSAPRAFSEIGGEDSFLVLILRDIDIAELTRIAPPGAVSLTRLGQKP
jgi:G3E family GTPase